MNLYRKLEKLLVDFTVQFLGLVMLGWGFPSGQTYSKETDGPYMCPEPFRGQTAHPGHVHRVAETWFLSIFVVTDFLSIL